MAGHKGPRRRLTLPRAVPSSHVLSPVILSEAKNLHSEKNITAKSLIVKNN